MIPRVGSTSTPFSAQSLQDVPRLESLESDTSEHSYTLTDVRIQRGQGSDTVPMHSAGSLGTDNRRSFSLDVPQSTLRAMRRSHDLRVAFRSNARPTTLTSLPESLSQVPEITPSASAPSPAPIQDSRQQDTARVDIPASNGITIEDIEEADQITGRVVRKRRRLPLCVVIMFGLVSCLSMGLAICAVTFGSLNWAHIRQNRATKSVNDLENDLLPLLQGIYNATAGRMKRFF